MGVMGDPYHCVPVRTGLLGGGCRDGALVYLIWLKVRNLGCVMLGGVSLKLVPWNECRRSQAYGVVSSLLCVLEDVSVVHYVDYGCK